MSNVRHGVVGDLADLGGKCDISWKNSAIVDT